MYLKWQRQYQTGKFTIRGKNKITALNIPLRYFFWATPLYKYHDNYIKLEPGVPDGAEVVVPERQLLPVHPDHVVISN